MKKIINAKNARNFAIQEILFITINRNAIKARIYRIYHAKNCKNFSLLSQFFAFIILCEKYSRFAKNARNEKCEKFCNTRNPIYRD